MPALRRAEGAVDSIKPADIVELKGTRNATDTTRLVFDTVNILFQDPMEQVAPREFTMLK